MILKSSRETLIEEILKRQSEITVLLKKNPPEEERLSLQKEKLPDKEIEALQKEKSNLEHRRHDAAIEHQVAAETLFLLR